MRIHVLSDLHNEFSVYGLPSPEVDVVVLAGDIGRGSLGIRWARQRWPNTEIVFVPGNHEYYGGDIIGTDMDMEEVAKEHGVHLLNHDTVEIGGVRFIGATLWTDFLLFGPEDRRICKVLARDMMNDYRTIEIDGDMLCPTHTESRHHLDYAFIENELGKEYAGKSVVVTHHLPSMLSIPWQYKTERLSAAYASNLDGLMGQCDVWIHGHTHEACDYPHPVGARIVCNPRGIFGNPMAAEPSFSPAFVLNI